MTVGLVSADLLAAGAGNGFDQVVVVVVDAQGGVVDFDGDDLTGVTKADLDALADDLGAAAAGHRALHPGGALVQQRSGTGSAGALEAGALARGQGQRDGAGQDTVEHDVGEGGLQAQSDPSAGELRPANYWSTEWYLPAMETVPVALTVRWISTGAPVASWVQDGRAGGGPAGRAPWRAAGPGRCW